MCAWTAECDAAFHEIKQRVVNNPKLYFIDYSLPIFIRCDASKQGCGAELFQVVDGFDRPICFISKTFNETEQRWSVLEQELFSAVWAVKRWSCMLEGHHFTILTDHKNILQLAKAEAPKVVRWRLLLMAFDFDIIHVPGVDPKHMVADCLSRLHGPPPRSKLSANALTRSQAAAQAVTARRSESSSANDSDPLDGMELVEPLEGGSPVRGLPTDMVLGEIRRDRSKRLPSGNDSAEMDTQANGHGWCLGRGAQAELMPVGTYTDCAQHKGGMDGLLTEPKTTLVEAVSDPWGGTGPSSKGGSNLTRSQEPRMRGGRLSSRSRLIKRVQRQNAVKLTQRL